METCTNQPAWSRDKTSSKKKKNKYSKSLLHQVMGCHKWTSTEINQCTSKKIKQMICEIVCCWMQLSRRSWIYSTGTVEMTSHQCTLNPHISLIMECDMNIWNRIYNSVSLPEYLITNVQHHFKSQISNYSNSFLSCKYANSNLWSDNHEKSLHMSKTIRLRVNRIFIFLLWWSRYTFTCVAEENGWSTKKTNLNPISHVAFTHTYTHTVRWTWLWQWFHFQFYNTKPWAILLF